MAVVIKPYVTSLKGAGLKLYPEENILITKKLTKKWSRGIKGNTVGLFDSSHVLVLESKMFVIVLIVDAEETIEEVVEEVVNTNDLSRQECAVMQNALIKLQKQTRAAVDGILTYVY